MYCAQPAMLSRASTAAIPRESFFIAVVPLVMTYPEHQSGTSMNDARRKEIQRAVTLIGEAKGILELALSQEQDDLDNMPEDLQSDEEGQIAEDVVDALERAAMGCGDAITACKEAM